MKNEDIAKELLSVLKEKMMYREGLPSDGWAVEKICDALEAAQQSKQVIKCPVCAGKGVFALSYQVERSCEACGGTGKRYK